MNHTWKYDIVKLSYFGTMLWRGRRNYEKKGDECHYGTVLALSAPWDGMPCPALAEGEGTGCKHGEMLKLPIGSKIYGKDYFLGSDWVLNGNTTIFVDGNATICLNGYKIDANGK